MFKSYVFDDALKILISIVYRAALIGYSATIILNSSNVLEAHWYALGFLIYALLFWSFYKKEGWKAKARLYNDYFFICFVLYGKALTIFTYPLLLLPIINSPNHSGPKRDITIYVLCGFSLYFLSYRNFSFLYLVPLFAFLVVDYCERIRSRVIKFNSFLYETIDQFQTKALSVNKTHFLYNEIIRKLNSSGYSFFYLIESILCFRIQGSKTRLVNGSFFVFSYDFKLSNEDLSILKTGKPITNREINVNGKLFTSNHVIGIFDKEDVFIYVINTDKLGILKAIGEIYTVLYLQPVLTRITNVLKIEMELKKERDSHIQKIKNKIIYVNNATLAMHFLRNKFSPIKAHFEMLDILDKETNEQKRVALIGFAQQNRKKIKSAINDILQRTNQILEKPENPFLITEINKISLRKIYTTITTNWNYYFEVETINMNWHVDFEKNIYYSLNDEYFEILVNDWIKNMFEYQSNFHSLNFSETPEYFNIYFINDFKSTVSKDEMEKMVSDFNSPEDFEMNRRVSHGLTMIKSFLKQMRIMYNLRLEGGNKIVFKLSFKKDLDESSSV